MALTFYFSTPIPLALTTKPRNISLSIQKEHFLRLTNNVSFFRTSKQALNSQHALLNTYNRLENHQSRQQQIFQ